jgi:hypothetical protein
MLYSYVIKFVSNLRQVGGFLRELWFLPPLKLDSHNIAEIVLKVAVDIITLTPTYSYV